jgi:ADP-ribosylglycohydrolase
MGAAFGLSGKLRNAMSKPKNHNERMQRALQSLEGLATGDAFGEQFFLSWQSIKSLIDEGEMAGPPFDFANEEIVSRFIALRRLPVSKSWNWTDDTAMAISIVAVLQAHGEIDGDALALAFGKAYVREAGRGYGPAMHSLLPLLARGASWQEETAQLFRGQGSFGNGAAMRAAPIGAYFADDLEACIENARRSAIVTHAHPEGVAGAIAVALGAAWAWRSKAKAMSECEFLNRVLEGAPESKVRQGLETARDLIDEDMPPEDAAEVLGSGQNVTAQDTVPFVLWSAASCLDNYEEALWQTVAGLGDRDTTCAMVGGIVALSGSTPIPSEWLERRESLPSFDLKN